MLNQEARLNQARLIEAIAAYQDGARFCPDCQKRVFQQLIDTGLAWQIGGRIGRAAAGLIEIGVCHNRVMH